MEDIRSYRTRSNEDDDWTVPDDDREWSTGAEDEVPFHIPRD
jgi:hypothetical protein